MYSDMGLVIGAGIKAEYNFVSDFQKSFPESIIKKSSFKEDALGHIDFIIHLGGKRFTVDVKSRKKFNMTDKEPNDTIIWLELVSITGNDGWVYGNSDYIVFEREDDWMFVPTSSLRDLCSSIPPGVHEKKILYRRYQRKGKKDEIVLVKDSDVTPLAKKFIKKWKKQ
jgi:hypothetical protein